MTRKPSKVLSGNPNVNFLIKKFKKALQETEDPGIL